MGQSEVSGRYTVCVCVCCGLTVVRMNKTEYQMTFVFNERFQISNDCIATSFTVRGSISVPPPPPYRGSPGSGASESPPGFLTLCRCHQWPVLQRSTQSRLYVGIDWGSTTLASWPDRDKSLKRLNNQSVASVYINFWAKMQQMYWFLLSEFEYLLRFSCVYEYINIYIYM